MQIAATIYSSFKVLTKAVPNKEFDGIAFRDEQLVIIERKSNVRTGPRELQRNFLADVIHNKTQFLNLPEMQQGAYTLEISRPGASPKEEEIVNQLMGKAEQLIRSALKSKCIEFTFNRPADEDLEYCEQVRYPKGFKITLRLASHVNGQGKGDEEFVKKQLPLTLEKIKTKLSASQRFIFLSSPKASTGGNVKDIGSDENNYEFSF